jgi:ribosomal protein S17
MSKLTKKYIMSSGTTVSAKRNKSITIQYNTKAKFNAMLKKVKFQSKWCTYSTGYPLRINYDLEIQ